MKTWQKVTFIAVLAIFVAASVTISLISISRPPYKFREATAIGGDETLSGWVFSSFNGNPETTRLTIDFVRDRNGENPDQTKPVVAVGAFAVNADEYAEELFLGASVRFIDETAFYNLKKLRKITVDPANEWFRDIDGVLFSKDGKKLILYPVCYGQKPAEKENAFAYADSYTVPGGVERIATFAFLKNEHIRDLTLPDTLKEIGDMAFFGCARLGSFEYDEAAHALLGTGFSLPDGVRVIGADAFSKCVGIAPCLYLPGSVEKIGNHAFFSCTGMKDVLLGAENKDDLELGASWMPKSIKSGAVWKAPEPQFGKERRDADELIENYKAERLEALREEEQRNG